MTVGTRPDPLEADERYCEELTRREAKNFYWGFIALPRQQRLAIYALYSFARQVDDAVDLARGKMERELLDQVRIHRERLDECFAQRGSDPVMRVLAQVITRYQIPRAELDALVDGIEMDLNLTRFKSWDELRTYCRGVASTVGRMCVRIFGYTEPVALEFADDLGVAMQLANILRDVREDAQLGRIYLPLDELERFGVSEKALMAGDPEEGWSPLVHHEIGRTEELFMSGLQVSEFIPRRPAACVFTMAGIYQAIVRHIDRDPYLPLNQRVSLGGREKLSVMCKSWLQAV